jgi:hypothetical protein
VVGLGPAGHQPRAAPQPHPHEAAPMHAPRAYVRPYRGTHWLLLLSRPRARAYTSRDDITFLSARSFIDHVRTFVVAPHISSIVRFVSALSLFETIASSESWYLAINALPAVMFRFFLLRLF